MDNKFDPNKMTFLDFKMVKGHVDNPEGFDPSKIERYPIKNGLKVRFNLSDRLVRADFNIEIKTKSKNPKEASGNFHFVFIYRIENLEALAIPDENDLIEVHPELGSALSSITYSTIRGILLTKLQESAV